MPTAPRCNGGVPQQVDLEKHAQKLAVDIAHGERYKRAAGTHSCGRGSTREDCGKAGPFSVERLKMDLLFVNVSGVQIKYTAKCRPS